MKPSLILHIGTEKTGSTSIQKFLNLNREVLGGLNIHIPLTLMGDMGSHEWMPVLAFEKDRSNQFVRRQRFSSPLDREQKISTKLAAFSKEIQTVSSRSSRWLISCEHLQSSLTKKADVIRLRKILEGLFGEIEILLYIRRPILTAVSLWSTHVKSGGQLAHLPLPTDNSYWENVCNYRRTVQLWQAAFPKSKISIRLFQKEDFVNHDLIDDFCSAIGIMPIGSMKRPSKENETLSHKGIQYLIYLNQYLPPFRNNQPSILREGIIDMVQKYTSNLPKYYPSLQEVNAYEDYFSESCNWILSNYFHGRSQLWSPELINNGASIPSPAVEKLTESEIALLKIIAEAWKDRNINRKKLSEITRISRRNPDSFI
jgi:hypothetical protein